MKHNETYHFLKAIPEIAGYESAKLVGGGWSPDLKFKISLKGETYLLRVSDISNITKKQNEFEILSSLSHIGIKYSHPLAFGELPECEKVYMLLSWIDGENVELMMPKLSKEQQYKSGFSAGQMLRRMHSVHTNVVNEEWKRKLLTKLDQRLELYKECDGYKIDYIDEMVSFIRRNVSLLENRPMCFLHGDYQGRNIIVDENCNVGIIDFERTSGGDPYEEFNRMMTYTRRWSIEFCVGQVDGYFEGCVPPEDFWRIVAFHCAVNLITTIVFGVHTKQKHIYEENEIAKQVIYDDFKGYTEFLPDWYKRHSTL